MALTLRLLRHGRTEWSDAGRYCGHADIGLSGRGRRDLSSIDWPDQNFTSILSSDLRRCRETAAQLGLVPRLEPALREFDFGAMEGKTWADLDEPVRTALGDYESFLAPGGESVRAFATRVEGVVEGLGDGFHLLITHGGVIQHLLWRAGSEQRVGAGEWIDLVVSPR